jgi:hypothetical protein
MSKAQKKDPELPPFVKSWGQFYRLLILWLVMLVVLLYLFTIYFK